LVVALCGSALMISCFLRIMRKCERLTQKGDGDTLRLLGAIVTHRNRAVYVSLNTNANPTPNPNPNPNPNHDPNPNPNLK